MVGSNVSEIMITLYHSFPPNSRYIQKYIYWSFSRLQVSQKNKILYSYIAVFRMLFSKNEFFLIDILLPLCTKPRSILLFLYLKKNHLAVTVFWYFWSQQVFHFKISYAAWKLFICSIISLIIPDYKEILGYQRKVAHTGPQSVTPAYAQ